MGVRTGGGLALRGLGEEDAARGFGLSLGDLDENLGADGGDLRLGTGRDTTVSGGRMKDCLALSTREAFSHRWLAPRRVENGTRRDVSGVDLG